MMLCKGALVHPLPLHVPLAQGSRETVLIEPLHDPKLYDTWLFHAALLSVCLCSAPNPENLSATKDSSARSVELIRDQ